MATTEAPGTPTPLPWERRDRAPLTGEWWARGLACAERLGAPAPDATTDPALLAYADTRLRRWVAAYPEHTGDATSAHRAVHGLSHDQLRAVLAERPGDLARRVPKPEWAAEAERVVGGLPQRPDTGSGIPADEGWRAGFAQVLRPFTDDAVRRLETNLARLPAGDAHLRAAALTAEFAGRLSDDLVELAARTLVLELNVASVSGLLEGEDPAARFASFVRRLRGREALADLFDEYAVLARLVVERCRTAVAACAEIVTRYVEDRPALVAEVFGGADPGPLVRVSAGAGDTHDGGRSVAVLTFAGGGRVVHKPRPIGAHGHFNDLLGWVARRLPGFAPRRLRVLDRGTHGWVEFVVARPCDDAAGAERYFRTLGSLLAVLHAVAATDMHFENVIAVGDQPVPVDLETLFHAVIPRRGGLRLHDDDPAAEVIGRSVQRVGLLPQLTGGPSGGVLDVGGMGADKGRALPFAVAGWTGEGTDRMKLVRVRQEFRGSSNRPSLDGRDLDPADHLEAFLDGFRACWTVLREHRAQLLDPHGPLAAFHGDLVRTVLRPTFVYSTLLRESAHPNLLRDGLDRDRVLSLIGVDPGGQDPLRAEVLRAEWEQLWAGDVPLFQVRADDVVVRDAAGRDTGARLPSSGTDQARAAIGRLGEQDLAGQEWIVRAAFASRGAVTAEPRPVADVPAPRPGSAAVRATALHLACSVADRLSASAVRRDGRVGWLGLSLVGETHWSVSPLDDGLFNGYPGVGLFLAQLARVTGDGGHRRLALQVFGALARHADDALAFLERRSVDPRRFAAFEGLAGLAFALDSGAVLLDEPWLAGSVGPLLAAAARWAGPAPTGAGGTPGAAGRAEQAARAVPAASDIVSGTAGLLAVAESLHARHGEVASRLADVCAEALAAHATTASEGQVWPFDPAASSAPLLGFSHGAGGIGWALGRYAARTGAGDALALARSVFAYESDRYLPGIDNWPDLRIDVTAPAAGPPASGDAIRHMHAWCHGAPGVGLARAALPEAVRTAQDAADLDRAVSSTAAAWRTGNHSLCHGDLGNLELFVAAAGAGNARAAALAGQVAEEVVADVERRGPLCGTPYQAPTPGLMTGLAGIGHGLLRIVEPGAVAPVLLLEPAGSPR